MTASADLPEGTWVEACDKCNAKGIKNGALCPKCEGRCYLPHGHNAGKENAPAGGSDSIPGR